MQDLFPADGWLVLLPTVVVLLLALWSRRALEPLVAGAFVGALLIQPTGALSTLADSLLTVLTDEDVAWVIAVCGLMGSIIALLLKSGASRSFAHSLLRFITNKPRALLGCWFMGIVLFVDDYLNSLAVGTSMRQVTDRFKTSREMLAYVIDSTAAPVSVLIPISTWAVFFGALIEKNGLAPDGQGVWEYIQAIPFMFYPWIAVAMVPLVAYGKIPLFGPMKKAELRAQNEGLCVPPGAEHIDDEIGHLEAKHQTRSSIWMFLLPMASLAFFTWYFDLDFLMGIFVTLAGMIVAFIGLKKLSPGETFDNILEGFKSMLDALAVLVAAFMFNDVNTTLGLNEYIITTVEPLINAQILPFVIFALMGFVSFATGSNWGVFVIILPIVTTLGHNLGADMTLVIGATLSASTFGSHACFYSDATVLTAQASGCTPFQHAFTQLPYAALAGMLAGLLYLALGFM
ncbi:sodium:proton antiporter [Halomonas denitrificans]|uniref:Na+/H+ antiporter NhaC family protein n=1 Tax=Halomonas TaxID=2745 RepID=UPI001A8C8E95|nr:MULTISPECIES: Na+/H+ antiporter NhaC family protein [Halomonas]MED5294200.1 Na+/H+ antiporter NhaC family protein [Pseudomonadota bacterium]MBN8413266.1 sodium:proton antiporter [Halomonas litopenaei]MBY5924162.1 sodium:proton antiporter [Halomonas sp. DP4Y7-2]MBY5967136.1 sodium:proton antiporter [Halomonas denitrificans]MBY5982634.1 sodium:proton antiporter [Halomonas sp. DP5Y7-2]